MHWKHVVAGVAIGVVVLAVAPGLMAAEAKSGQPTVKRARLITLTATVEAVDLEHRLVTLKGPRGNEVTIEVGDRVKNLPQVQVGDQVKVKYYEALAFRVLPPGATTPSASAAGAVATAQPGEKPAGVGAHEVTVTVTIEAINHKASTVTFKGPAGNSVTVRAQDPKNLQKIKVGDQVEITYTEALGISVETVKKKG
jgi:ribosomal 50S subunit-recycling heat shock protein